MKLELTIGPKYLNSVLFFIWISIVIWATNCNWYAIGGVFIASLYIVFASLLVYRYHAGRRLRIAEHVENGQYMTVEVNRPKAQQEVAK